MNKLRIFSSLFVVMSFNVFASEVKKTTLNDLLNKVKDESRGAKLKELEKKTIVVPNSQLVFEYKKPFNVEDVKPSKSSDFYKYDNPNQAAYEKTLDLQIEELYKLSQKFSSHNNRGELWLRLAELYVEKAEILDARKQTEYDRALKKYQENKDIGQPKLDLTAPQDYHKKAIRLYEAFIRDFPSDEKAEQALFFLGYSHFEIGNISVGIKYYNSLIKRFPKGSYAAEARFAIGENLFENEKWADAYKQYSFLIKDNKHILHTMALYKSAWCLYRLGKTSVAIKYLDFIIKSSRTSTQTAVVRKKINSAKLESEALKDLVVFFADEADSSGAIAYFKKLDTAESTELIEKLAYYLIDKGNTKSAKDVFKYLISVNPESRKSFEYQYQVVQAYFYSKDVANFKSELYIWINNYGEGSNWYIKNKSDNNLITRSYQLREQTLRNYILQQHQTAQNTRAIYSQSNADEGYRLYFKHFSKSDVAGDMHFYYGELLYDMRNYNSAIVEYKSVVNNFPKSQYVDKASQNILLSAEKTLPKDDDLQKRLGESIEPIALSTDTKQFIETVEWYLKKYPNSDKAAEIKFRTGRLYYLTNNFDSAEKIFREIVQEHPQTKFSDYSANLLLDIYNLKKDYAGLQKVGSELLANQKIADGEVGSEIRSVLEKASFKRAQNLEIEKKYLDSAKQYESFAMQNPKSNLIAFAFFNAAVNFERAGKNKEAANNYNKVLSINENNTEPLRISSKKLLAKIYVESGLFEEAGRLYLDLANRNTQDGLKYSYLYNAGFMNELVNNKKNAIQIYERYILENKNQFENAKIVFKIAELYLSLKEYEKSQNNFSRYILMSAGEDSKKIEAHYNIFKCSEALNKSINYDDFLFKMKNIFSTISSNKKTESKIYLARVSIAKAQQLFDLIKKIVIPLDTKKQKLAVSLKLTKMKDLGEQLASVIKYDSADEIIEALYVLANANEHMATSLKNVSLPQGLTAEQKKTYLTEIDKITSPFEKKSEESYKLVVERGKELQVYNQAYAESYKKLNKKYPKEYYLGGESISTSQAIYWQEKQ